MNERVYYGRLLLALIMASVFFCSVFIISSATLAKPFQSAMPTVVDPGYKIQILVPGSYFHGIHGLAFDSQDNLYAGSIVGQSIYHVDTTPNLEGEYWLIHNYFCQAEGVTNLAFILEHGNLCATD